MALRLMIILAMTLAASSCAPTLNVLPPQTPEEKRISELETSIAEAKAEQAQAAPSAPKADAPKKSPAPAPAAGPVDPVGEVLKNSPYERDPLVVGSVVAVVNGDIVTRDEVLRDAKKDLDRIDADPTLTAIGRDEYRRQIIGTYIKDKVERLLLLQESRRVIRPEEAERIEADVDSGMAEVMRALGTQTRLEALLRKEGHTVESQKQEELDNRRIRALLSREVASHVDVTPGEVQAYYAAHPEEFRLKAQVQVREIFVSAAKNGSPEKAEERAKALRERVVGGADFAEVARTGSDGPNAAEGGLWEWATAGAGTFRPEVEHAAFALRKGEVSPVVVSEIGAHVLRAEDVRLARTRTFAESQSDILAKIRAQKWNAVYVAFLKRLMDKSCVDIRWK